MTIGPAGRVGSKASAGAVVLIVILTHSLGVFLYSTVWRTLKSPDFDVNDFKAYYAGALALSEGRRDLLYPDPAAMNLGVLPDQPWVRFAVERGVPTPSAYIYPPFLAVVLRPITAFSYHRANQLWFAANLLLFAASAALLMTWRPVAATPLARAGVLFAMLNFYPTFRAFQCGQVGLVLLFLLSGALWCLERGRDPLAGWLVAIAAAIKLTPAVLVIWMLAARRWRAAAWSAAASVALLAISVAGAGWSNHVAFVSDFLPVLSRGAATFANQSLEGFLARLGLDVSMNVFEFVDEPLWLRAAGRIGGAALLIVSLWVAGRSARRGESCGPGIGLVVLASLLASPISWEHHFVLALVPLAVLIVSFGRAPFAGAIPFLLVSGYVLLATNAYDFIRRYLPYAAGRLAISYAFYGAVLLWMALVMSERRARRPGEAEGSPAAEPALREAGAAP